LLILSAEIVKHGREIAYEVKLEAGDTPADKLLGISLFVDDGDASAKSKACSWGGWPCAYCSEPCS